MTHPLVLHSIPSTSWSLGVFFSRIGFVHCPRSYPRTPAKPPGDKPEDGSTSPKNSNSLIERNANSRVSWLSSHLVVQLPSDLCWIFNFNGGVGWRSISPLNGFASIDLESDGGWWKTTLRPSRIGIIENLLLFPIGPPEWKSNSSFCPAIVLSPSRIPNMGSVAEMSPILKELMLPFCISMTLHKPHVLSLAQDVF